MVNGHFIFTALPIILKKCPPSELMKHIDIILTVQGLLPNTGEQLYYVIISFYVYEILLTIERHFQQLSRVQQVCINQ